MSTDFEAHGLADGRLAAAARQWLLTVDFEAFPAGGIDTWVEALRAWARCARAAGIRFSFFVSIEDLAALRASDSRSYRVLADALADLVQAGSRLYPHNHCVFDPATGVKANEASGLPQTVEGYPRRASVFYDVVYRSGLDWGDWLSTVFDTYRAALTDAGVDAPARLAFRPGGWDHGVTRDDLVRYVAGLARHRVAFDSSATSGEYGTASWRVGAPFGENIYRLTGGVTEIAPCWSLNCGLGLVSSPQGVAALTRLMRDHRRLVASRAPGAFDTVLHFDHLFHATRGRRHESFAVTDISTVRARVERFFAALRRLRRALALDPVTFEDVALATR